MRVIAAPFRYLNSYCCESHSVLKGTGIYYNDPMGAGFCLELEDAVTSPSAPSTATLYGDATLCCASMPWINKHYCVSRSDNHATSFSDRWYGEWRLKRWYLCKIIFISKHLFVVIISKSYFSCTCGIATKS